jgi:hypothetical protein
MKSARRDLRGPLLLLDRASGAFLGYERSPGVDVTRPFWFLQTQHAHDVNISRLKHRSTRQGGIMKYTYLVRVPTQFLADPTRFSVLGSNV